MSEQFLEVFIFALRREQTSRLAQLPKDLLDYYLRPMLTVAHLNRVRLMFASYPPYMIFNRVLHDDLVELEFYLTHYPEIADQVLGASGILYARYDGDGGRVAIGSFIWNVFTFHLSRLTVETIKRVVFQASKWNLTLFLHIIDMHLPCLDAEFYRYIFYGAVGGLHLEACRAIVTLIDVELAVIGPNAGPFENCLSFRSSFLAMFIAGFEKFKPFIDWMANETSIFDYMRKHKLIDVLRADIRASYYDVRNITAWNVSYLYGLDRWRD